MLSGPLDNPIWHALTGPHAGFAFGRGSARHYPRDVAPFSAIAEPTAAAYGDLAADLPPDFEARLFRPTKEATPPGWETISARPIVQMVADGTMPEPAATDSIVPLGKADAEEMLALAEAARPGPSGRRTVLLGHHAGVRRDGRLVAMAGERFRLRGYVELSAICVHPDWRGMGFGSCLTEYLAHRTRVSGRRPKPRGWHPMERHLRKGCGTGNRSTRQDLSGRSSATADLPPCQWVSHSGSSRKSGSSRTSSSASPRSWGRGSCDGGQRGARVMREPEPQENRR